MATKETKPAEKREYIKGTISPNTIALLIVGGGIFIIGWKWLSLESERQKQAKEMYDNWMTEIEELNAYQAANPTKEGLDLRNNNMTSKLVILREYSQTWIESAAQGAVNFFKQIGITIGIAAGSVIAVMLTGAIIWWLIKHRRPPGSPPPTFRCDKDGLEFPDAEALANHLNTAHQPNENGADIAQAQAIYEQEVSLAQDAAAVESGLYSRARYDWRTLSPQERVNLAWGMSVVSAYGMSTLFRVALVLLLI